ncbi:hypothetical protein B5D08_06995 [Bifidobacterium breve]|nr:hypothetical protein B5D08_06995 [Bifidobacterium breve]
MSNRYLSYKLRQATYTIDALCYSHGARRLAIHPRFWTTDVGRILRTFKIKKNVEVTDNGKDNF